VCTSASISIPASSTTGSYNVNWGDQVTSGVTYKLQGQQIAFIGASEVYSSGANLSFAVSGKGERTYYYRVKATGAGTPTAPGSRETTGVSCLFRLATHSRSITRPAQAKTITAGISQNHAVSPAGDVDFVKFTAMSGNRYHFETMGTTDTALTLYGRTAPRLSSQMTTVAPVTTPCWSGTA